MAPVQRSTPLTHIHTQGPVILTNPDTDMCLDNGRKPENTEETHMDTTDRNLSANSNPAAVKLQNYLP